MGQCWLLTEPQDHPVCASPVFELQIYATASVFFLLHVYMSVVCVCLFVYMHVIVCLYTYVWRP